MYYLSNNPDKLQDDIDEMLQGEDYYLNNIGQDMKYIRGGHLDPYMYKWDGTVDNLINYSERGCNNHPSKELGAYFCTKLIEINGWKIPKDYPRKVW